MYWFDRGAQIYSLFPLICHSNCLNVFLAENKSGNTLVGNARRNNVKRSSISLEGKKYSKFDKRFWGFLMMIKNQKKRWWLLNIWKRLACGYERTKSLIEICLYNVTLQFEIKSYSIRYVVSKERYLSNRDKWYWGMRPRISKVVRVCLLRSGSKYGIICTR